MMRIWKKSEQIIFFDASHPNNHLPIHVSSFNVVYLMYTNAQWSHINNKK